MAGPVLQVDDFSSSLARGCQGGDAERMHHDGWVEAELLCILLHELLHGAGCQMIRVEAIKATAACCRHRPEERAVTIISDACNIDPLVCAVQVLVILWVRDPHRYLFVPTGSNRRR